MNPNTSTIPRRYAARLCLLALLPLGGCVTLPEADVTGAQSQVEIRQIQTREYPDLDKRLALRSTIATLQDLGFFIDSADLQLGTITGTRHQAQILRITVTARERPGQRIAVRANARLGDQGVADPLTYQDFFVALDKAVFLARNRVD